ncbi:hypothetical protein Tco_1296849, partial [Tanacetum coccineum]
MLISSKRFSTVTLRLRNITFVALVMIV